MSDASRTDGDGGLRPQHEDPEVIRTVDDAIAPAPRPWMRPVHEIRARCFHGRQDAALAAGLSPWGSAALYARARVLTSARERQRIAFAIVGLVRLAEYRRRVSPRLRLRHGVVLRERAALLRLAARLEDDEPVDVATLAQLAQLVWDGSGPAFEDGRPPGELECVVRRCVDATGVRL